MGFEVKYDLAEEAKVDAVQDAPVLGGAPSLGDAPVLGQDPLAPVGCHSSADSMEAQARASGNSELLDQLAADYPTGPHDKPQSMCPAFGLPAWASGCAVWPPC